MAYEEISITPEQKKLILGYKGEALNSLQQVADEQDVYKDIVAAASETTNIPKKIISKYFKSCYNDKVKEVTDEAEVIGFLNEA